MLRPPREGVVICVEKGGEREKISIIIFLYNHIIDLSMNNTDISPPPIKKKDGIDPSILFIVFVAPLLLYIYIKYFYILTKTDNVPNNEPNIINRILFYRNNDVPDNVVIEIIPTVVEIAEIVPSRGAAAPPTQNFEKVIPCATIV